MLEYRTRETGEIVYNLVEKFPDVSIPASLSSEDFDSLGVDPIFEAATPSHTKYQNIIRDGVEEIDGKWFKKYSVVDMTESQMAAVDEVVGISNKEIRNSKLSACDWTQLGDVNLTADCKTAFTAYRQALRDADMLAPVWPDMPEEVWVS